MKEDVVKCLKETKIVAIIRGMDPEICVKLAEAYQKGGIKLVEVTYVQTGDPAATTTAIRAIKAACPQMHVGAGTVITEKQLQLTIEAGGEFMVAPSVNPALIAKANAAGLAVIPGAYTPTEIVTAWEAGASCVKLFPIRSLGPTYVKDVLAPLKHIPLLAVGGVTPDNIADYIKAGCVGACVSGALVNKEMIAAGAWDKIADVAKTLIERVHIG